MKSLVEFIRESLQIKIENINDVFNYLTKVYDTDLRRLKGDGDKPNIIKEIINFINDNHTPDKETLSKDDVILQTFTEKVEGKKRLYVYICVPSKSAYPMFVMSKALKGRNWSIYKSAYLSFMEKPNRDSEHVDVKYCSFKMTSEIKSCIDKIETNTAPVASTSPTQFIVDIVNGGELSEAEYNKYRKYIDDNFVKPNDIKKVDQLKFESSDPEYWGDIKGIKITKNESLQDFISDNKIDGVEIEDLCAIKVIDNVLYITNAVSYGSGDYFDLKVSF